MIEISTAEQQKIADALRQANDAIEATAAAFTSEFRPAVQAVARELEPLFAELRQSVRTAFGSPGSAA